MAFFVAVSCQQSYSVTNNVTKQEGLEQIVALGGEDLGPASVLSGKTKQLPETSESCSRGPWCKEDLNRLMPWIDKIWALHPYFPELMGKERTLQGAELLK